MSTVTHDAPIIIYALSDPETQAVRYIGVTKRPKGRLREHCTDMANTYRGYWVRDLISRNLKPVMTALETVSEETWEERERWWIAHYRERGAALTNAADGGRGVLNPPLDVREKGAAISKARWADPVMRAKNIEGMRRTQQKPEEKERKSKASRGNAEHLRQEREKLWQDPAHVEKMREVGRETMKRLRSDPTYSEHIVVLRRNTIAERMKDPEYRAKQIAHGKARMAAMRATPGYEAKTAAAASAASKATWGNPVKRAALQDAMKAAHQRKLADPDYRARNAAATSAAQKAAWADPVKRAARIAAIKSAYDRKKAAAH